MYKLFDLPVRGEGTIDIESFGSYLIRLANLHYVSVGVLLNESLSHYKVRNHGEKVDIRSFLTHNNIQVYARPNRITELAVKIIESASDRQELDCTTFLSLINLPRITGIFEDYAKWCPYCMYEFQESGDPPYFKLQWCLKHINSCETHLARLASECEECGARQSEFRARHRIEHCQGCGAPLGSQSQYYENLLSWSSQNGDMFELINEIVQNSGYRYPGDGVHRVFSELYQFYRYTDHPSWEALKVITYNKPKDYLNNPRKCSLITARRLAAISGIKFTEILRGEYRNRCLDFETGWRFALPEILIPIERRRYSKIDIVLNAIADYLRDAPAYSTPSLKDVAVRAGVSTGYIAYNFPELAKGITTGYKLRKTGETMHKRLLARTEAESYFFDRKRAAEEKSRKAAFKEIRESTGLPKNILRGEVEKAYRKWVRKKSSVQVRA